MTRAPFEIRVDPTSKIPIRIRWTCCDVCHREHLNRASAWFHWLWLTVTRA